MSVVFYKAPRVNAGEAPTAAQMIGLANAANVKIRSGLGDFHWRERQWFFNIGRQIRNSDEFGFTPAQGELFEFYAYIKALGPSPYWPEAPAGEFAGASVSSPIPAFLFGNEDANFDNEENRLLLTLWDNQGFPTTAEGQWNLSKQQRGVIDPNTGAQSVPAIEAGRSSQRIAWRSQIPHAKNYGSFQPLPVELLPACGATEAGGLYIPSYEIKFTGLRADVSVPSNHGSTSADSEGRPVVTYSGSCPEGSDSVAAGHVQDIQVAGALLVVFVFDGTTTTFDLYPRADWIHGLYTGDGKLMRGDGGHYSRMIWAFVKDFRGTLAQRADDDYDIEKLAFSFDEFFKRQYHLAPNLGFDTGDEIITIYPRATISAPAQLPAGTLLKFNVDQTSQSYLDGFVMTGMFAKATNLFEPVTLEVLSGTKVVARITLTPSEPEALKYLTTAVKPEPLSVRLPSGAKFAAAGEIVFEANELLEYKPDHFDAYALLRLMATQGGFESTGSFLDGSGYDCEIATQLFKDYEKYGCIVNRNAAGIRSQDGVINANPVYDSFRRVMNEMFHMVHRREFLTYERDGLGRPVLRFKRYALGASYADQFVNIAPSDEGVTAVTEGVEYIVRSHTGGGVFYGGTRYSHQQRFIGSTLKTFEADGDALLLEYEGIRSRAPKKGWSNEWVMSEEFHFYHPAATSNFEESKYADWYTIGNRCHAFASNSTPGFPADLARISDIPVHPGVDPIYRNLHLSPEVPSGYNYALGANQTANDDFCKSCQVYVAPYELASVTVEFAADRSNDVVCITFKEPFRADASAPSSWNRDAGAWSPAEVAALRAEPYRTTDNGLREYMLYLATNTHGSWKTGDSAAWSQIQSEPDNPFGAIMPRFFFTSLVRKPYEDGNATYEDHDTRITIDEFFKLEIRLNAWCEGAIDGFSTQQHICDLGFGTPYDFSFTSLLFNATGALQLGRGHGPMVNTDLDAATFNQFADCLDALFMFRIEGLMEFKARSVDYQKWTDVEPAFGSAGCPLVGPTMAAFWEGKPPEPAPIGTGAWGLATSLTASVGAAIAQCNPESGSAGVLGLQSVRHDAEFQYAPIVGFENALAPNVQGLISGGAIGVVGIVTGETTFDKIRDTTDFDETACSGTGGPGAFWDGTKGYTFDGITIPQEPKCMILTGGLFHFEGGPPGGAFKSCTYAAPTLVEISGSSSHSATFTKTQSSTTRGAFEIESAIIVVPMLEPNLADA